MVSARLPIRIGVIDDHAIARGGLERLISSEEAFEICGSAATAVEAEDLLRREQPDILLCDLFLGKEEVTPQMTRWKKAFPAVHFVVVSMIDDLLYAQEALESGAEAYVCKSDDPDEIIAAIHAVLAGKNYLGKTLRRQTEKPGVPGGDIRQLEIVSPRERQVLRLIGAGLANKALAERLFVSVKTIETHKENLKNKLGCATMAELQRKAVEWTRRPERP
jgi:two-component system response regulator NreC